MNISNIFFFICVLWVVSEILLLIFRRSKENNSNKDSGSLKTLNFMIYISITAGVYISFTHFGHIYNYHYFLFLAGLVLIILGLIVRWTAIITLRRYFTVNVAIQTDHKIIQSGLYKYIRHPSYSGMLLSFLGLGISLSNWVSLCIILFPIIFAVTKRIQIEEQALRESFGKEYPDYSNSTRKLIPWLY
jgi:protein-S-isoprenylcysteine O-methyltransferase Ste14